MPSKAAQSCGLFPSVCFLVSMLAFIKANQHHLDSLQQLCMSLSLPKARVKVPRPHKKNISQIPTKTQRTSLSPLTKHI